tara:strand:+ start:20841 stop:21053 length:213 start_codon:yes stop_codon:yes gene_type:complete
MVWLALGGCPRARNSKDKGTVLLSKKGRLMTVVSCARLCPNLKPKNLFLSERPFNAEVLLSPESNAKRHL